MRPTRYDGLALEAGDTVDLAFRLWSRADGQRFPYVVGAGARYVLTLRWQGGAIVAATSDSGAGRLVLDQAAGRTVLRRRLAASETAAMPIGRLATLTLVRVPAAGERRTWLTGTVKGRTTPEAGPGDTALDLVIDDTSLTVDLAVDDAAQATTLALASEAAFVSALLFG